MSTLWLEDLKEEVSKASEKPYYQRYKERKAEQLAKEQEEWEIRRKQLEPEARHFIEMVIIPKVKEQFLTSRAYKYAYISYDSGFRGFTENPSYEVALVIKELLPEYGFTVQNNKRKKSEPVAYLAKVKIR